MAGCCERRCEAMKFEPPLFPESEVVDVAAKDSTEIADMNKANKNVRNDDLMIAVIFVGESSSSVRCAYKLV
eukprot:CAMPEP_0171297436 /NCGR_PEP_ID=MMETSP0816-20121228/6179_1 /TAXON_ID=420281 /ORGANISM="Proboscia inermis, Strain CCAP1064/1" /LENGTH=71 /DNA_ID=CAMNT_0011771707 /DNA_START=612 /DNA_END=827 /DNA_ORIENTATION=+